MSALTVAGIASLLHLLHSLFTHFETLTTKRNMNFLVGEKGYFSNFFQSGAYLAALQ